MRSGTRRVANRRHKYRAVPVVIDGIRFASTKEGNYYRTLKALKNTGGIKAFEMQIPFKLPGKTVYRCDFKITHKDGSIQYVDVKGYDTPMGKLKRRQTENLYPVKIELA